jgi:hypothetical protein
MELGGEKGYIALLLCLVIGYTAMHISIQYYRDKKHEVFMEKKDKIAKINNDLLIANNALNEAKYNYLLLLERRHNRLIAVPNDSIYVELKIQDAKKELNDKIRYYEELQVKVDSIKSIN